MKVLVVRTGSPLWWNTMNSRRASASGECDTEPCIRYLTDAGYEVAYYGQIRNYTEDNDPLPDLRVFCVDFTGLQPIMGSMARQSSGKSWNDRATAEKDDAVLRERCDSTIDELIRWAPDCVIEYPGDKFTWYRPGNDNAVEILDACWQYAFPTGYMYHRTKYKRNWIITDPVLYPRNGEMFGSWPETFPNAILSQESNDWSQVIQGRRVRSVAYYAGCEHWLTWAMQPRDVKYENDVVIASHVHHKRQGQRRDHRTDLWNGLLQQCGEGNTVALCGRGWEDMTLPENCQYRGVLKTFTEVMDFMNSGLGGPVVPQRRGFNTSKARFYALNGACPYMLDRDPEYRYVYDSQARILPLDHISRWDWGDPTCLDMSEDQRHDTVQEVLKKTKPDFTALHELIERRGDNRDGKFGGYRVV